LTENPGNAADVVRQRATALLARREHSAHELKQKLAKLGLGAEVLSDAIEALRDEGLQSDRRFAGSFVRERMLRGQGPQRIQQELRQRGVSPELIEAALDEEGGCWRQRAQEVLRKKYGATPPADAKARMKRQQFLVYRGFPADIVRTCLRGDSEEA